jgi:hypothetical protein
MENVSPSRSAAIRNSGAAVALSSLAVGGLIMFALPSSCSVVTSFFIAMTGLLLIAGVAAFFIGQFLLWRERKIKPA